MTAVNIFQRGMTREQAATILNRRRAGGVVPDFMVNAALVASGDITRPSLEEYQSARLVARPPKWWEHRPWA